MSHLPHADFIDKQSETIVMRSPFDVFFSNRDGAYQEDEDSHTLMILINQYYQDFPEEKFQQLVEALSFESDDFWQSDFEWNSDFFANQLLSQFKKIAYQDAFKIFLQGINKMDRLGQIYSTRDANEGELIQSLAKNLKFFATQLLRSINHPDSVLEQEINSPISAIQLRVFRILHSQDAILCKQASLDWKGLTAKLDLALLIMGLVWPHRLIHSMEDQAKSPPLFFQRETASIE